MTIKDLITTAKRDNGLSNRALAKRLHVSEAMLRWLVQGKRKPGAKVLSAIAREFPEHTDAVTAIFLSENAH